MRSLLCFFVTAFITLISRIEAMELPLVPPYINICNNRTYSFNNDVMRLRLIVDSHCKTMGAWRQQGERSVVAYSLAIPNSLGATYIIENIILDNYPVYLPFGQAHYIKPTVENSALPEKDWDKNVYMWVVGLDSIWVKLLNGPEVKNYVISFNRDRGIHKNISIFHLIKFKRPIPTLQEFNETLEMSLSENGVDEDTLRQRSMYYFFSSLVQMTTEVLIALKKWEIDEWCFNFIANEAKEIKAPLLTANDKQNLLHYLVEFFNDKNNFIKEIFEFYRVLEKNDPYYREALLTPDEYFASYNNSPKVLVVGGGWEYYPQYLMPPWFYTLNISETAKADILYEKGILDDKIRTDFKKYAEAFDIIILEHLPQPLYEKPEFYENIAFLLKKGGFILDDKNKQNEIIKASFDKYKFAIIAEEQDKINLEQFNKEPLIAQMIPAHYAYAVKRILKKTN